MAVITISRGVGSGGDEIARMVAERLNIPYLDRAVTATVAEEAGVSEDMLQDAQRVPSLRERMLGLLAQYPITEGYNWPGAAMLDPINRSDEYRRLIAEFLRSVARRGSAVIVGHGSTVILADHPQVLRCLIVAPNEIRVKRIMEVEGLKEAEARRRMLETDRDWRMFLKTYYEIDWLSSQHYDLVINTAHLRYPAVVDLIAAASAEVDARALVSS